MDAALQDNAGLLRLIQAALDEADAAGNTLVAAMLAECVDALEQGG